MLLLLSVILQLQVTFSLQAGTLNSNEPEGILIQQGGNAPQWPDGTYALPEPIWGCPAGWKNGWRYQDTEDHHNNNKKVQILNPK